MSLSVWGQQPEYDSLRRIVESSDDTNVLASAWADMAFIRLDFDLDQCKEAGNNAIRLAEQISDTAILARAYYSLGYSYWRHSYYDSASYHLKEAISYYQELGDSLLISESLFRLAMTHFYQAQFHQAISLFKESLHYEQNRTDRISYTYGQLGFVYATIGELDSSNYYFLESFRLDQTADLIGIMNSTTLTMPAQTQMYSNQMMIANLVKEVNERSGDLYQAAYKYSQISGLYRGMSQDSSLKYAIMSKELYQQIMEPSKVALQYLKMGTIYSIKGMYDLAEVYLDSALALCQQSRIHPQWGSTLEQFAILNLSKGDTLTAIDWYSRLIQLASKVNHPMDRSRISGKISDVYRQFGEANRALAYAREGHDIGKKIGSITHQMLAEERLYKVFRILHQADSALYYFELYREKKERFESANIIRSNQELMVQYETAEREAEIETLNIQNELKSAQIESQYLVLVIIGISLLVVLPLLFFLRNKLKRISQLHSEVSLRNEEIEILLKEIHHRVKNNLQMVSSILNMQDRRTKDEEVKGMIAMTQNRVKAIGLVHEHLYKSDHISGVDLRSYLPSLIKLTLGSRHADLSCDIEKGQADLDTTISIAMIVHELITNTIKYAKSDELKVHFSLHQNGSLNMDYQDNGKPIEEVEDGFGWTLIKSIVRRREGEVLRRTDDGFAVSVKLNQYIFTTDGIDSTDN